ncbi:hypothetical protein TEA_000059 [Camellia sinensis var. sinensis]|uniref:Cyclic nucleotide-binding domain-containing protein n=1 Tax=Camellia sinensis var. sinensis TaxID=542762 RepID=A0A4S4E6N7_CAMSN|nr:hypothetical protein TEA_000059 [Camellia sinensis var. sinensis]
MNRILSRPASHLRHLSRPSSHTISEQFHILWHYQILDPNGDIVTLWNHIFLISSLIALFIDPLYFYLPYVGAPACMSTDTALGVAITFFRTLTDLFYLLHMLIKFRTAFVAPSSRVFGRGELVMDAHQIAMRYLKSDFLIDLAATLPLPQASPSISLIFALPVGNCLSFLQFFVSSNFYDMNLEGESYNFILIWIVIPATRNSRADHANNTLALIVLIQYIPRFLDQPERNRWLNATRAIARCDAKKDDTDFKFGMFSDAFTNEVASSPFIEKYLYCLWWGLRNLSSYGQNLTTSIYIGETLFCIVICIGGLILFAQLIGQMQVPFFSQMDDQLLDAICERLVSSLSTQGTYIVREDDPVNEMLFIIRGQLESSTTNGGRSGFFNSITLRPGDFCGEELLTWALMPNSSLNLPSSTRTVRTLSEVEAFALRAEDLKFVANQFKHLHSKKLQHAFRYYSHQWRTWGACFLQAAWRRYQKKKLARELAQQESLYYTLIPDGESSYINGEDDDNYYDESSESPLIDNPNNVQHLGATILASKFAANTRRGVIQKVQLVEPTASLKMPKLFKPDEPDFSVIREDD